MIRLHVEPWSLAPSRREALDRTRFAAGLLAFGELAFALLDAWVLGRTALLELRLAHIGMCIVAILWLGLRQDSLASRVVYATFVVLLLPLFPIFWIAEEATHATGLPWTAFVGHKLLIVGIALIDATPVWLAVLLISVFALDAAAQWSQLDMGPIGIAGEPWVTLFYAVIASALVVYRARSEAFLQRSRRAEEQARLQRQRAAFALAVNDLANTPLQTLSCGLALLQRAPVDTKAVLGSMSRALLRLENLADLLAHYEAETDSRLSFDAAQLLRDAGLGNFSATR